VFEEPKRSKTTHNESATIAVLGSIGILSSIASYTFGKRNSSEIKLGIAVIAPNGETRNMTLELKKHSVEPVDNQILKQITEFMGGSDG
jgi:hypothetical protein